MSNELTIYNNFPTSDELKNLAIVANAAQRSGVYKGSADSILMTLLSARELNIGPMLALNGGIYNIQGKVELSARLMNTLIRRQGHQITIKESNNLRCVLIGKRKDTEETCEISFTIEDAKLAKLIKAGGPWETYPTDMCYARALSRLSRRLFSDVIGNCYIEGEIDASRASPVDPDTLPVAESTIVETDKPKITLEECLNCVPPQYTDRLKDFLDKWCKANTKTTVEMLEHFSDLELLKNEFREWVTKK